MIEGHALPPGDRLARLRPIALAVSSACADTGLVGGLLGPAQRESDPGSRTDACASERCGAAETTAESAPPPAAQDAGCGSSAVALTRRRLDLLTVVDNSYTMTERWAAVR
jgi:hypothetical protein